MRADYTEIFQHEATVAKYEHVVFAPDSYAWAINKRQRRYLRGLVKRAFPYRRPVQHDFACGTGRAIRILHGLVRAAHGYDSSEPMLTRAAESGSPALQRNPRMAGVVGYPGGALVPTFGGADSGTLAELSRSPAIRLAVSARRG